MTTHGYETLMLPVTNLTLQHTLVGESGGLSAVYDVDQSDEKLVVVETEHGYIVFHPGDEVVVLADD